MEVVVAHGNNKGSAVARGLDLALQNGMERWEYLVPPNDLSDLVHFNFNNLSPLSLLSMANEFCEAVSHVYLPWMAQYLVKRAGIEPNLHSLYMVFIDYTWRICLCLSLCCRKPILRSGRFCWLTDLSLGPV